MARADLTRDVTLDRDLGARVVGDGVVFTVWAPQHQSMVVSLDGGSEHEMTRLSDGYFRIPVPGIGAGQLYWYLLPGGRKPDPASRFQPQGVFGPSMVVDPSSFAWSDAGWRGVRPIHQQVIYEMHVGTFTTQGTWAGAQARLPELAALGVTTIEIMPLAEFAGRFGWGYDGVFFFAPYHHYGTPDEARRFVDAAHAHGLSVILDVVYNHIGPVGSVLHEFSDGYFSEHDSEWGRGFNLDGPQSAPVRQFMRANVVHWLQEYHVDGLRFDAVHAFVDRTQEHIIDELTRIGREACPERRLFMVAENEAQDVSFLTSPSRGLRGVDSTWNEDWHHSAFVALTGRREAYFTDYQGTAREFAAMAQWNLLYQGQWYSWQKKRRGSDARDRPAWAFVSFLENHDQVANTGFGTRLHQTVNPAQWRAMTALLLLGPGVPMLFQGQEWCTPEPFSYFADHEPPLAEAVRKGRQEFLAQFPSLVDEEVRHRMPSPDDEDAFRACQIEWQETRRTARSRQMHVDLLALRRNDPVLAALGTTEVTISSSAPAASVLLLRYRRHDEERLVLINLGALTVLPMNDPLLAAPAGCWWSLAWCSDVVPYGGHGVAESFGDGLWTLQPNCAWLLRSVV